MAEIKRKFDFLGIKAKEKRFKQKIMYFFSNFHK